MRPWQLLAPNSGVGGGEGGAEDLGEDLAEAIAWGFGTLESLKERFVAAACASPDRCSWTPGPRRP